MCCAANQLTQFLGKDVERLLTHKEFEPDEAAARSKFRPRPPNYAHAAHGRAGVTSVHCVIE